MIVLAVIFLRCFFCDGSFAIYNIIIIVQEISIDSSTCLNFPSFTRVLFINMQGNISLGDSGLVASRGKAARLPAGRSALRGIF